MALASRKGAHRQRLARRTPLLADGRRRSGAPRLFDARGRAPLAAQRGTLPLPSGRWAVPRQRLGTQPSEGNQRHARTVPQVGRELDVGQAQELGERRVRLITRTGPRLQSGRSAVDCARSLGPLNPARKAPGTLGSSITTAPGSKR